MSVFDMHSQEYQDTCMLDYMMDFIKNILICVPKMNDGLTGLERIEGE